MHTKSTSLGFLILGALFLCAHAHEARAEITEVFPSDTPEDSIEAIFAG